MSWLIANENGVISDNDKVFQTENVKVTITKEVIQWYCEITPYGEK